MKRKLVDVGNLNNRVQVAPDRGGFVMSKKDRFVEKNASGWRTLESYNARLAKIGGIKKLNLDEVQELSKLIRLTSYHLAYAKTHFETDEVVVYLNRLVATAQSYFHARGGTGTQIAKYFAKTFPEAVMQSWRYWGLAFAFFAIGTVFAAFFVAGDLHRLQDVVPAGFAAGFSPYEVPDFGDGSVDVDYSMFTAIIMTNNIAVAINAFAFGILAGLGTVYIMVLNGLMVGGLFGYFHVVGADMLIAYALVLPHGVLELFAIFICGGSGLMLGQGILMPGDFSRKHSIIYHAKKAAVLMPGVVVMLVIAAIIEGFFTPLAIAAEFKLVFAATTGVVFVAYCTLLGGGKPENVI